MSINGNTPNFNQNKLNKTPIPQPKAPEAKPVSTPTPVAAPVAPLAQSLPLAPPISLPKAPVPATPLPVASPNVLVNKPLPQPASAPAPVASATSKAPTPAASTPAAVPSPLASPILGRYLTPSPQSSPTRPNYWAESPSPAASTTKPLPQPVAAPSPVASTAPPKVSTPTPSPLPSVADLAAQAREFMARQFQNLKGSLDEVLRQLTGLSPELLKELLKDPQIQAKIKELVQKAVEDLMKNMMSQEELNAIKNYLDIARQLAGSNGYLGAEDIDKIARATSSPDFMAAMLRSGLFNDELVRPGIQGTPRGNRRGARRADFLANRMEARPNGLISRIGGRIVYNMTRQELAKVLEQMGVKLSGDFPRDNTMLQLDPAQILQAIQDAQKMQAMAERMKAEMEALKAKLAALGINLSDLGLGGMKIQFPNGIPIPPSLQSILDSVLNGKPLPPPLNSPGQLKNNIQITPTPSAPSRATSTLPPKAVQSQAPAPLSSSYP